MRSPPNPQRRVIEAVADALHAQQADTAIDDADSILATHSYRQHFPPPVLHPPSPFERWLSSHHEAGHAVVIIPAADSIELKLNESGGGECRITGVERLEDKIMFALAGIIAEARVHPRSIHKHTSGPSYDLLVARLLIDQLNEQSGLIRVTYKGAARRAAAAVDANWSSIENVALALNDAGELSDADIRLFARCER